MNRLRLFFLLAGAAMAWLSAAPAQVFAASVITSASVEPLPFDTATGLTAECLLAEDSPAVVLHYRWFLDGEELQDLDTEQVPGDRLRRGAMLSVVVTPETFSGEILEPFVSMPLEVANAAPRILSQPPEFGATEGFSYQVQAQDTDGDHLNFLLVEGPAEMTLGAENGLLVWSPASLPEGNFPVRLRVEDGYGGWDEQAFELSLAFPEPRQTPEGGSNE
ncbi:putative Ig domain-containing protein [Desulfuromonas acetexigens]|uniref:Ig-like domain-containing protein n=1 Tax=Trichloromonas acetexigens TaxID=38815 RepID=A0A550J3E7_9BACT|nr:putative Ig domain-containing protein [Desulfuromonas acetexigens]TRO77758.1 hypothetical protein FL622_17085 [Desulfuromonas acetexigens]